MKKDYKLFIFIIIGACLFLASCSSKQTAPQTTLKAPELSSIDNVQPGVNQISYTIDFLQSLKNETRLELGETEETFFKWNYEGENNIGSLLLKGFGFTAGEIYDAQPITEYFQANRFSMDIFNTLTNNKYRTTGFILDSNISGLEYDFACLLTQGKEEENDPNTQKGIIQLQCGQIPTNAIPRLSKNKQLANHLAQKYGVSAKNISLEIIQDSDTHVQGKYSLPGDSNKHIFLGTIYDNNWYIVHSGDGSPSCRVVRAYEFPDSMNIDCVEPLEPTINKNANCDATIGYTWCEKKYKCLRSWKENCGSPESKPTYTNSNEEKAIELGKRLVLASGEYTKNQGQGLTLEMVEQKNCTGCWDLEYEFTRITEENKEEEVSMKIIMESWEAVSTETNVMNFSLLTKDGCEEENGQVIESSSCVEGQIYLGEIIDTENKNICCAQKKE